MTEPLPTVDELFGHLDQTGRAICRYARPPWARHERDEWLRLCPIHEQRTGLRWLRDPRMARAALAFVAAREREAELRAMRPPEPLPAADVVPAALPHAVTPLPRKPIANPDPNRARRFDDDW